ncbi:unnamed protein product [Triticum turgidum subsp. durum]|uniref:Uncharacterized protein n=1 Tax=Triticum turgidum subsp. durum TaxID=4567 RepID=A0A9R0Z8T4_TRITD|nr:unnamed protein product [Triticum turgidum subsp. durum]
MTTSNGEIPSSFRQAVKKGAVMLSSEEKTDRVCPRMTGVVVPNQVGSPCMANDRKGILQANGEQLHLKHMAEGGTAAMVHERYGVTATYSYKEIAGQIIQQQDEQCLRAATVVTLLIVVAAGILSNKPRN